MGCKQANAGSTPVPPRTLELGVHVAKDHKGDVQALLGRHVQCLLRGGGKGVGATGGEVGSAAQAQQQSSLVQYLDRGGRSGGGYPDPDCQGCDVSRHSMPPRRRHPLRATPAQPSQPTPAQGGPPCLQVRVPKVGLRLGPVDPADGVPPPAQPPRPVVRHQHLEHARGARHGTC